MAADENLGRDANAFFNRLYEYKYSYHFDWLGRPIIWICAESPIS